MFIKWFINHWMIMELQPKANESKTIIPKEVLMVFDNVCSSIYFVLEYVVNSIFVHILDFVK